MAMIYILFIIILFLLVWVIRTKEENSTPKKNGPRKDVYIETKKTKTITKENFVSKEKKTSKVFSDAEISGKLGEKYVFNVLNNDEKGVHRTLNNFRFRINNHTSEIDHIVICEQGIFVIETKNHQGNIYGLDKAVFWKQYLGNDTYEFYNPIIQNENHVRFLKKRAKLNYTVNSLVVFTSAVNIKIRTKESLNTKTISLRDLKTNVYSKPKILSGKEIEEIYNSLNKIKGIDNVSTEEHIKNVNRYLNKI